MFNRRSYHPGILLIPALVLFAAAGSVLADPPSRVARVSYIGGDVSMQAAGLDQWSEARINRPLITGDSLYTDRASRVEMEIGAATVRLDERTSFRLLNLDDQSAQIELTAGTLNLTVRRVFEGQTYEVDTPTLALLIDRPGQFRIDIAPQGDSTMVTVIDGDGDVYGLDNASFRVRAGQSYRFHDSRLRDYEVFDLPRQDDFDRWCYERTDRYERSPSRRYVSEEMIGYADLDDYGRWSSAPSYGSIWYPTRVEAGWAPYRNGHWAWIDPWGWTWVDNAPWGFAPSHYGRWAYVGSRWGWVPGPRHVRPIYAPALVAFVGGGGFSVSISSGGPIGWFPLGPRDVYVPWYRGSRNYFNNINVRNTTIINNTYITNVYNDYSRGRPVSNFDYAYRNNDRAFTAVSQEAFVNARSVQSARVQVAQAQLSQGRVVSRVEVAPTARSFVGGGSARDSGVRLPNASFNREVIARTAPPARRLDAQERIRAISRNNNQPLAVSEMRELSVANKPQTADRDTRRIRVVDGAQPSATATPDRPRANVGQRVERSPAGETPARNAREGTRTETPVRNQSNNETPRAPTQRIRRADSNDAAVPTPRTQPAQRQDERPTTISAPRTRVDREAAVDRSTRQPATPRTQPEAAQRNRANVESRQPVRSEPDTSRDVRQRAPVQRQEPVIRAPQQSEQRRAVQPAEPAIRAPQQSEQRRAMPEQRVAPQRPPVEAQPRVAPERREVQPRVAPARTAVPQPAPNVQQRQAVQPRQPVQQQAQPQRRAADKSENKDDSSDEVDSSQRKRRERN